MVNMTAKKYSPLLAFFLIAILLINAMNVQSALADSETPTEPPAATDAATEAVTEPPAATDAATEAATEPPATETQAAVPPTAVPQQATVSPVPVVPTNTAPATHASATEVVLVSAIENTDIVVLDAQGQAL